MTDVDALEWKKYKICEKFHWLPEEYDRQKASTISKFWMFIKTENKAREHFKEP